MRQPAAERAARRRAAYGAPEAPVIPTKTSLPAAPGPLRGFEEDRELAQLLLFEPVERRHRRARRLAVRALEVGDLPLDPPALRALGRQIRRSRETAAGAEVAMAVEARELREDLR